jgi:MFS family permease
MDTANVDRLLAARALRAFGDGFVSLLLPVYLLELGYTPFVVGLVATATLVGSGAMTLAVGLRAHRHHYRTLLLAAAALMAATGIGFATISGLWPLLVLAVVGTLNPSSGDVSVFLPLEHAVLARVATDAERTRVFAHYALTGTLVAALGALAAGIPGPLAHRLGVPLTTALQAMFVVYALLGGAAAIAYRGLPRALTVATAKPAAPLTVSRRAVYRLAALFSLDAFGGGFVVQSMVALWLHERFAVSLASTGALFFVTGLLSAFSYLVAVRLAKRIGLVNTMVFTHLPANLCLVAVPFVPDVTLVFALLVVRSALSQMDVPTRTSYVMAIVTPAERPAAASVTAVPRSIAAAASPLIAGSLLAASSFGWPLLIAGAAKIVYDLLLLASFRRHRPPEEQAAPTPAEGPP